jgi:hypothetical protein
MRKQKYILLMLIGALLLAACGQATSVPPTLAPTADLNILRTEVAATVLAQCAAVCALTPSATVQPTSTMTPTPTVSATATSATPGVVIGTPGTGTPAASLDQAKWVSQSVMDGTVFTPGQTFTMTWRLQNVGKTTWTSGYRLRYYSGELFGAPREIALDRDVPPNDTVEIAVNMKAPAKLGKYRTDWVMSNESLFNFNQPVFLEITVANAPTATVTVTVAPTATSTPQELTPAVTTAP